MDCVIQGIKKEREGKEQSREGSKGLKEKGKIRMGEGKL